MSVWQDTQICPKVSAVVTDMNNAKEVEEVYKKLVAPKSNALINKLHFMYVHKLSDWVKTSVLSEVRNPQYLYQNDHMST